MNIETYDPLFGEIRAAVFAFGRQLFSQIPNLFFVFMAFLLIL